MDKNTTKSMAFGYDLDDLPCVCECGRELDGPLSECECEADTGAIAIALEVDAA